MKTVKDVELRILEKFTKDLREEGVLPEGYRCSVKFHGKKRKKRLTASFETNWSPDTDSIIIRFKPAQEQSVESDTSKAPAALISAPIHARLSNGSTSSPLSDLIRALDRFESRPGYGFVALKWFRDTALPAEGFPWAAVDSQRQEVLREAIDRRMILTSKVPNPRSPQFPVTAIRLNRLLPEVKAILGNQNDGLPDFQPIAIRGENLSATILRDRR